jgi:hypothetical protein
MVDQAVIFDTRQRDSRGERIFTAADLQRPGTGTVTRVDTRFATTRPPALSYIGNTLVLAFTADGIVNIATPVNPPGSPPPDPSSNPYIPSFVGSVPATTTVGAAQPGSPGAVQADAGAPYLHHVLENIYLAAARRSPQGSVDIQVLGSGDGLAWNTEVATIRGITASQPVDPSIAGPPSQMVVAYRATAAAGTVVWVNGGTFSLDTRTVQAVGAAFGPGPSQVTLLTCADPSLIVRGHGGDTAVPAGGRVAVATDGNPTLLCGAGATIDPQCPASTKFVTITRPPGSSNFGLKCWS